MLDNINQVGNGLNKKWIYASSNKYELSCDYLQKVNYCIQDYNSIIKNIRGREDICFLILLVTWIKEACEQIEKNVLNTLSTNFEYSDDDLLRLCNQYIRALRSFVVAHPLSTFKHEKYCLDGNYICVDISCGETNTFLRAFSHYNKFFHFSINGLEEVDSIDKYDYRLHVYSKNDNLESFKYFGCTIEELELVAKTYLDKLKEFDHYLSRQKKKDYLG